MKSTLNAKLQFANAGLIAVLTVASSAVAQTLPKEGNYDYTACWSGVSNMIAFSKTHFGVGYEFWGSDRSNPPGGMFDNNSFRCVGMNSTFGKENSGNLVCEAIDRDGDKRLNNYSLGKDGKYISTFIAGTGKYEGLVTSGTVENLGPFPMIKPGTFQGCNRQTGTYKLK